MFQPLYLPEKSSIIYCIGSWVDASAGLNMVAKIKNLPMSETET
jgi:hypothetical protein